MNKWTRHDTVKQFNEYIQEREDNGYAVPNEVKDYVRERLVIEIEIENAVKAQQEVK